MTDAGLTRRGHGHPVLVDASGELRKLAATL